MHHLKLVGTDGLSKGEEFLISKGEMVILGRSRNCSICLANLQSFRDLSSEDEVAHAKFRTVDGKHLKIYFKDLSQIILEDLSQNGTYLDGSRISKQVIVRDLESKPRVLLLGLEERFRMEFALQGSGEAQGPLDEPGELEDGRPRTEEIVLENLQEPPDESSPRQAEPEG